MVDSSVSAPKVGQGASWLRGGKSIALPARTVVLISAAICLVIGWRFALAEGGPATIALAGLVCAALGAAVVAMTGRVLLAAVLMGAHVALVTLASTIKLHHMNMVLHAYDLAFYLTSVTNIGFLWQNYRAQSLAAVTGIALSVALAVVAYRVDPIRIARRSALAALAVLAGGAWSVSGLVGERRHSQFEYEGMYLTSFYQSWSETIEALWRGQLLDAAPQSQEPLLRMADACEPAAKPPHIILIHHESAVPPSLFPTLEHDRRLDQFFKSDDGQSYKLRVETYGGASVLTEFSVLTGLSTYAFGGMRQFVQRLMSGKVKETIPQVLTGCGYRNVMFYPMLKSFTSADKFFKGAGIEEIIDLKQQKARRINERDRFYYDNALDEIGRHVAASGRPLFTFIETMATHWPYDNTYEPHMDVPGGRQSLHPELNEYLRRLWISGLDFEHLRQQLAQRFPDEQFLIVRYGDHHPMATRMLLGYDDRTEAEDVRLDRKSIGFVTFFAVNGVNFAPHKFTSPPILDVPYLGTVLLEAAGLPLTEAYKERQRLKEICEGHSFDCAQRNLVLGFHRRLIDSGIVSAR